MRRTGLHGTGWKQQQAGMHVPAAPITSTAALALMQVRDRLRPELQERVRLGLGINNRC